MSEHVSAMPTTIRSGEQPGVSPVAGEILSHYTERWDESQRLSSTLKGNLERARLHDYLAQHLPATPARVADIGGGPGVHARWMQDQGYSVALLDPVQRHIDQAKAAGVPAVIGDARRLPWENETFDAALLAGPMYHLVEATDRRLALREAVRVLKPGGVLAVIAINRAANLIGAALANTLLQRGEIVEGILKTGFSGANERMAHTFYHSLPQLRTELNGVGLTRVTVHGLTGPGGWLTVALDAHFKGSELPATLTETDPLTTALECARIADEYPELVPASSLFLAIGSRE
ncbi:class I SAM-dependent methyltransferase [Kribbella deserti]|uniref:Class I SAM-dependent methyltransferase n=1 Tax=Kribbella deserti TaxID=1926257 RepID=A0ABV6QDS5_9ACTN